MPRRASRALRVIPRRRDAPHRQPHPHPDGTGHYFQGQFASFAASSASRVSSRNGIRPGGPSSVGRLGSGRGRGLEEHAGGQIGLRGEQRVQRGDETADGPGTATRKPTVGREDQACRWVRAGERVRLDPPEVLNVLRHEHPVGGKGRRLHLVVGLPLKRPVTRILHRSHIATSRPKLLGDPRRVHLVEPQPHPSRRRSFSRARSSRSTSRSFGNQPVDLIRILAVTAHRNPNLLHRHPDPLSQRPNQLLATLRRAPGRRDHLPHIRSADHDRAAPRRPVAKKNPGMAVQPHTLADVALSKTHDRLATLSTALPERAQRLGLVMVDHMDAHSRDRHSTPASTTPRIAGKALCRTRTDDLFLTMERLLTTRVHESPAFPGLSCEREEHANPRKSGCGSPRVPHGSPALGAPTDRTV